MGKVGSRGGEKAEKRKRRDAETESGGCSDMWGWQVALYLFFGGLSAGSFAFAAVLQLAHGARYRRTVRVVVAFSLAFLAVGTGLLLTDVSMPLRAMDVVHSFRNVSTSWMARGVWVLMGCAAVFFLYALAATLPFRAHPALRRLREPLLNVLGVLGIACSFLLAGYTGMLLTDAEGIRAWNTAFVPALFVVSALDTGTAFGLVVFHVAERKETMRRVALHRFDAALLALVCLETALLAAYMAWLGSSGGLGDANVATISFNGIALASLPVVFALLLCAAAFGTARFLVLIGKDVLSVASSLLSLGAGVTLRFAVLALGVHAALIW